MSRKHPIISVTGSSGAGTTTVKHTFDQIFRREDIKAVSIEGDAFHRFDRAAMKAELDARLKAGDTTFSHFSFEANDPRGPRAGLPRVRRDRQRADPPLCPRRPRGGDATASPPGTFTDWAAFEDDSDLLFYEGLHGAVANGDVNLAELADLKIGVVPVINLEWTQKIHRDRASRGYTTEAVTDVILRRMHAYVHCICPQFTETDINFQRVPVVDTSNPFIARWIPTADESLVVIRFRSPAGHRLPLPRLDDPRELDEPGELDRHPRQQARPRDAADPDAADPAAGRHREARLKGAKHDKARDPAAAGGRESHGRRPPRPRDGRGRGGATPGTPACRWAWPTSRPCSSTAS